MSWFGRQLRTYSKGSTSASFVYDADGLRSSKTVGGVKTTYQYVGDQLFYENRGNGNELYYFYDSYGNLSRIYHHNNGARVAYFVATNAQGDIVALYNASGVKVGAYDYDAWGNQRVFVVTQDSSGANVHTQINPSTQYLTHIVNINPIRYRGYFYDRDLGLYYLQSRYYDSDVGRFINTDNITDSGAGILGYNTFMYCGNNPVNAIDPSGHFVLSAIAFGFFTGAAVSAAANFVSQTVRNRGDFSKFNRKELLVSTVVGGITGALSGGFGAAFSTITNASKIAISACRVVTNAVINTAGDTMEAMCMGERISTKNQIESFAGNILYSSAGLAVSSKINTNKFLNMTKREKRVTLKGLNHTTSPITNKMIKEGMHKNTLAYSSYLAENFGDYADYMSIGVNLFNEANKSDE